MSGESKQVSFERIDEHRFLLEADPRFLNFDYVERIQFDNHTPSLDVLWRDGAAIRQLPTDTPAFVLTCPEDKHQAINVTLERAHHIQSLHLAHGESGSYFTPIVHEDYSLEPVTLTMLLQQVASSLTPQALVGEWTRRTLELPSGNLPGREGIASFEELLELGVITQATFNRFISWQSRIAAANITPGLEVKRACIREIVKTLGQDTGNPLTVKLIREEEGGVVVPHVTMMPRITEKMMIELTKSEATGDISLHTITPGRKMPRHPIPQLYAAGTGFDKKALNDAAWLWSRHAHVELPPDETPYIERTIDLLRGTDFRTRFLDLFTEEQQAVLIQTTPSAYAQAQRLAKAEVKEFAAFRIATTVQVAKQLKREWQEVINETKSLVLDFTEGVTLQDYLTQYHLRKILADPAHALGLSLANEALASAYEEGESWLNELYLDLEAHKHDLRFVSALEAWSTSPDSTADRGHDGIGYNSGLLHFFEYRGSRNKRGRFEYINEPATVEGFIAFTERLQCSLDQRYSPDAGQQVAIIRDANGNERTYILLDGEMGEFIVAFQKSDEAEPKLTAMFNRVTQQSFKRMLDAVLLGNDRGQINRLGQGIKPVFSNIYKRASLQE